MPKGLMLAIGMPKPGGGGGDIGSPDSLDSAPSPKRGVAPETESPEEEQGEAKATPEEVGYHSGDETCQNCEHMGKNGDCMRWGFDVQPGGWCHAYSGQQEGMGGEQEQGGEEGGESEGMGFPAGR